MSARSQKSKGNAKTRADSVSRNQVLSYLDTLLSPTSFVDYCPNGLQVQGRDDIALLISGVTASQRFIEAAAAAGADAVLVHHGWFWRGDDPRLTGARHRRTSTLLDAGMSLFAYHLPLDAHPSLGNNAQLGQRLGWPVSGRAGKDGLVFWSDLAAPMEPAEIARQLHLVLARQPMVVGDPPTVVSRIAWCTGAAQDAIEVAIDLGAQAYVSGEISERTTHVAREAGIAYFAAGHHATERFGVQAVGNAAADALGIEHRFVDDDNPV